MNAEPIGTAVNDPVPLELGHERMAVLARVGDHLMPAAHGMPSAAEIVTDARVGFVLRSRPDLRDPLMTALRPELGDDIEVRLDFLATQEPDAEAALQLVIVAGYYTAATVRALLGYEGQIAKPVNALEYPTYLEEGLLDSVVDRGPIWRDPETGNRAGAS